MTRPGDRPQQSRGRITGEDKPRNKLVAALLGLAGLVVGIFVVREHSQAEHGAPRRRKLTPEEQSFESGHELRDMRLRTVVRWLALLTIAVVVLIGGITIFERGMVGHIGPLRPVVDEPPRVTPPPQPRLETQNGEILSELHTAENRALNNYTWIDQAAGTVSLPVDRAIELTIQRGLPVRSQPGGQASGGLTLPQGSSSGRTLERIP